MKHYTIKGNMSNPYDKQVGGNHYQNMKIQHAEFINKNKMQFAEGNAINIYLYGI